MLFSSLEFLCFFFPVFFLVYFLVSRLCKKAVWPRNAVLLVFSLVFYAWGELSYFWLLMLSIGINYSAAGAIAFHIGEITISLSGLAVGALTGIILNAILPGKDYKFDEDKPDDTGVCFAVKGEEN